MIVFKGGSGPMSLSTPVPHVLLMALLVTTKFELIIYSCCSWQQEKVLPLTLEAA